MGYDGSNTSNLRDTVQTPDQVKDFYLKVLADYFSDNRLKSDIAFKTVSASDLRYLYAIVNPIPRARSTRKHDFFLLLRHYVDTCLGEDDNG